MKFSELHKDLPYVTGGKEKILSVKPVDNVTLLMPGRHAKDTTPEGGDFVVLVSDTSKSWEDWPFSHADIFRDFEEKYLANADLALELADEYFQIVVNDTRPSHAPEWDQLPGIWTATLLDALLCLAVAEHRRYHQHEKKFGGRFLPLRYTAGIVEGLWTAADAIKVQRFGRSGVERLEKNYGTPILTRSLFDDYSG